MKPAAHSNGQGVSIGVSDEQALPAALQAARRYSPGVMLERLIPGRTIRLFVIGFEHVCTLGPPSAETVENLSGQAHASLAGLAVDTARRLNAGVLVMSVVIRDISKPLEAGNGAVINVDLAPWLDRFLPAESPWLKRMAERFLAWLIPPGQSVRVPTIAVTGTNGKTTTCRMLAHIVRSIGRNTGLACTEGVYINDDHIYQEDIAILDGHYKVFESPLPDVAILEHHHAGLVNAGVASRFFDVVVCCNVTADHLGHYGINNVAQMAEVKRSLPERGRDAVVLNADDPFCMEMIPHLDCKRLCLVSIRQQVETLLNLSDLPHSVCCVETVEQQEWIVFYQHQQRRPLVPVAGIPATFDGKASFNTLNAMHAISAAILSGMDIDSAVEAMTAFSMSVETTPGRLNVSSMTVRRNFGSQ